MNNKLRYVCMLPLLLAAAVASAQPADFRACVASLRGEATSRGISAQTFDVAMTNVEPDQSVLDAMDSQPEFKTPIWDYLAALVDDQRISDGRAKLAEWASVLDAAERKYGVDRHVIVAIWGVESDYGKLVGGRPLVRSLATGACSTRRTKFFRDELMATLRILQDGDMQPESLRGSWAGAFGHTQFMPTTFQRLAVDFDGDGKRDIVGSIPDALGSTANYLVRAGWKSGQRWGFEVRLPPGYSGPSGRGNRQLLGQWSRMGVVAVDGQPMSGSGTAALLLPSGAKGPAFLILSNFYSIYAYNSAESYALAIAHLSDRLRGAGPFSTAWPTDDPGLSRAQRRDLQVRLNERGFDVGQADGAIGPRTRAAIRSYQATSGLREDGHAGVKVLESLKAAAPLKTPPTVEGSVR